MICKQCNFENDNDARFCENCGAALQGKSPVQVNKGLMKVIWGCLAVLYCLFVLWQIASYPELFDQDNILFYRYGSGLFYGSLYISIVIPFVIFLVFKKIEKSFGITAILLSLYITIPLAIRPFYYYNNLLLFLLVLVAALATVLIYKYSFAENKKL
jgi:hypothetical protein